MEETKELFSKKRNIYKNEDAGMAFLLANTLPLLAMFIFVFAISFAGVNIEKVETELWYLIIAALISQLAFLIVVIFINKVNKISFSALKIKFKLNWKTLLICVAISIVCFLSLYNFIEVFDFAFESMGYKAQGAVLPLDNAGYLVLNLILLAVLPAIMEEIVFRGVVLNGLRSKYGDVVSVLMAAGLFAIMHASLSQLVYPFIMGIIFGVLVLRTGNLLCSIIVHFLNNTIVVVMQYVEIHTGFSFAMTMNWWTILLAILIAAVGMLILFLLDKFVFKHKTKEEMIVERDMTQKRSVFMIAGIVICVIMFVLNLVI